VVTAKIAFRNLLRRPMRTALTTMILAIVVGAMFGLSNLAGSLRAGLHSLVSATGAHLIVFEADAVELLTSSIPLDVVDVLSKLDGVTAVAPGLDVFAAWEDRASLLLSGWPTDAFLWDFGEMLEGSRPQPDDAAVVLGASLAERAGLRAGDEITLLYETFKISGIIQFNSFANNNRVLMPLRLLQKIAHRDSATVVYIQLVDPLDRSLRHHVERAVKEAFPHLSIATVDEAAADNQVLELLKLVARWINVIAAAVGLLVTANTMFMAINERITEIGLLHAIGWSRFRVFAVILCEAGMIGVGGGVLGLAVGLLLTGAIGSSKVMAAFLPPTLDIAAAALSSIAILMVSLVGAFLPAWRASRMQPSLALAGARR
jgi:putative ABC transport system permease protein